jgi:tRNA1Val (adenine37-N6)-methyltransferase
MGKVIGDFRFKQFTIQQGKSTHKVGTDGVLLGAWASVENVNRVLDIGTGTGLISLMIAQRTSDNVLIDAVELLEEDAMQAKINFDNSPWRARVSTHTGAVQNFRAPYKYDLIISNPPFFMNSWTPPDEKRSQARHTSTLNFKELIDVILRSLSDQGRFSIILPNSEGKEFTKLAAINSLYCQRLCEFRTRTNKPIERWMMEFAFQPKTLFREELLLYAEGNNWSEQYRNLTRDFYLDR